MKSLTCEYCLDEYMTKPKGGGNCGRRKCCPNCSRTHRLLRNFRHGLWRYYRMTIEEYDTLRVKQDFRCAICRRHESEFKRRLAVDHDHETGQNRGLLCINCNPALGKFKEDVTILERAIIYLKQWG